MSAAETTYYTAAIKGNPWRLHAKTGGAVAALCGRKPGESKGRGRMVDRTGWYHWALDTRRPNCVACIAALAEATGSAS